MNKELALRTFGYLIGHYKTHNETTINKQEIEAIEFMLKNNEDLEQQVKTQQLMINKAINLLNAYIGVLDDTSDLYFENVKSILELEVKKEK